MKKMLLAVLAVAGLATACRKDNDDVVCPEPVPASLENLMKRYAPPVQVFELTPNQLQTIRTAGGATLYINPDAFVRANNTVPDGPQKLEFQEIYSPAEMILADMPTQTLYGQPLESGGEFNIRVWEGTNRLKLQTSGNNLQLLSPVPPRTAADTRDSMRLWTWVPPVPPRIDSSGWKAATRTVTVRTYTISPTGDTVFTINTVTRGIGVPVVGAQYSTTIWPDTLGWLNCDAYLPGAARVTVSVASEAATEQRVYLIPHDRNGTFRPYPTPILNQFELYNLPSGLDLTAVVLQVKNGKYYFGTHRAPVTASFVYRPVLDEVSEEELVRRIRLL
ncbi:MAG: hypothetical protein H7330_13840 [Hymenobacteraceae bacterium]|nr:hypothetical protein [Hymenobacteraceae bacterium]